MKAIRILMCLLVTFVVFSACGGSDDDGGNGGNGGKEVEVKPEAGKNLYGQIVDTDGKGIKGVIVSDGTTSVTTNAYGIYQIKRAEDAEFVYYSTPYNYEIEVSDDCSAAKFYEKIPASASVHRQDFTLRKRSGTVTKFTILGIGDPQVKVPVDHQRFSGETVPKIKEVVEKQSVPTVILGMGDNVEDNTDYMAATRLNLGSAGVPAFSTIGNHDYLRSGDGNVPRNKDAHCALWGPTDYSFSMGSYMFICMDNVRYSNASSYSGGFTDAQVAWLEEHLASVSSQKPIIMFYHIPMRNSSNSSAILKVLSRFTNLRLMCGHTHYQENVENAAYYEHIHAAACGTWWWTNLNVDAAPLGFMVFEVDKDEMKNWYYQPSTADKSYQIRLYRADQVWTGPGAPGNFSFGGRDDEIIANVWNADSQWKIQVYEDGELSGTMSRMADNPKDMWCMAVAEGNTYEKRINGYIQVTAACKHLYKYVLRNKDAQVKVVATDRFGNVYEQTQFTTDITEGYSGLKQ